jgi:type VII secretion protein EccB
MPSRQDQLHSYQFMVQRVVAALVMRETDPAQSPFRRAAGATLASVLVAAIALAGIGVYGLIVGGGSTNWRNADAVIVEKETGALFVYRDEKLHPVLNYASALLIVGKSAPKRVLISSKSIAGVPRGTPLGINDAPDSLPSAKSLVGAPWTLCSTRPAEGEDAPRSVLLVGAGAGGSAVTSGQSTGDKAVLARHPDDSLHLIWHNRRHRIQNQSLVLPALGWSSQQPVRVAPALLNAIPAGGDLAPIDIPGRGEDSPAVEGTTVGEVFVVNTLGGGEQYAVGLRDGLAEITEVQAALLIADPRTLDQVGQKQPTKLSSAEYLNKPRAGSLVPKENDEALPATAPAVLTPQGGTVCAVVRGDSGVSDVRVGATVPNSSDAARTGQRTEAGTILADLVMVQPGRGAVVEAVSAPGASGGALSVVTDLGVRYAVPRSDVLGMLGYGDVHPVRMPANLVSLLPSGRALDPDAARAPAVRG